MSTNKRTLFKKFLHFCYGMGGSIVIIGALAKILHIDILGISGSFLLGLGLGVEAFIFAIASVDFSSIDEQSTLKDAIQVNFQEDGVANHTGYGDPLEFEAEDKPLEQIMVEESESVKHSMEELNENVQALSNMYGDMLKTMKK